jgi:hypothetical protein
MDLRPIWVGRPQRAAGAERTLESTPASAFMPRMIPVWKVTVAGERHAGVQGSDIRHNAPPTPRVRSPRGPTLSPGELRTIAAVVRRPC